MNILLENFRCFAGKHTINITPLTLLVGENSAGKSTFLAALSVISDFSSYPSKPRFDMPPYNLGGFDTIVTHSNKGTANAFSLGFEIQTDDKAKNIRIIASYSADLGQATLCTFRIESQYGCITLSYEENILRCQLSQFQELKGQNAQIKLDREQVPPLKLKSIEMLLAAILNASQEKILLLELLQPIMQMSRLIESVSFGGISVAPIRSKPKRTYDQLMTDYDPEGDHVPYAIARAFQKDEQTLKELNQFGKESGLFNEISVKNLGDKLSDPFQLHVKMSQMSAEMSVNLTDVGYGVSQSLPIIVQSVLRSGADFLLLQQPEVHLHPKAQAALGSFFVQQVTENHKRFVIETHSDYLLDRIRQAVASGLIMPQQVSIIFFDKPLLETTIHHLSLDDNGNILDVPPSYRRFFLEEEMNILMRGS
jgi:AAA15 family ATPase/GTPase